MFVSISSMRQITNLLMINSFLPRPVSPPEGLFHFPNAGMHHRSALKAYAHCSLLPPGHPSICPSGTICFCGHHPGASPSLLSGTAPFLQLGGLWRLETGYHLRLVLPVWWAPALRSIVPTLQSLHGRFHPFLLLFLGQWALLAVA